MIVTLWGTRGSLASASPDTVRYGGNTACVDVQGEDGTRLVLDAGTGIRNLGATFEGGKRRVDLLLTHLHMDHIQGLGFFRPLQDPDKEVHIWGPASTTQDLRSRLTRYLSPPLFPIRLRELPSPPELHDVPVHRVRIGGLVITAELVCHPGPTVGYRISEGSRTLAYLPDHEPALCYDPFPGPPRWTSGYNLAKGVDLLIHDAQYSDEEYPSHLGWGHSSTSQVVAFARHVGARRLIPFHHDPVHDDRTLDAMQLEAERLAGGDVELLPGTEGLRVEL